MSTSFYSFTGTEAAPDKDIETALRELYNAVLTAKNEAEGHASDAETSETNAANSASAASSSEDKAEKWAEEVEDTEVETGKYSALHHAAKAAASASAASSSESNASGSALDSSNARDKAEEWAENPEDTEVETGKYSAKHHAAKAASSASNAANSAQAAQDALDDFPAGGAAGQVLSKIDATDYNTQWIDAPIPPASDLLSEIKTVDGVGSGLNADLLDGQHASAFAAASHDHPLSEISDWPASVSITEVGYLDGVTSSIQTQLNGKSDTGHTHSQYATKTGTETLTNKTLDAPEITGAMAFNGWDIIESSGDLLFQKSGTTYMRLDASGNLAVAGDITAYETL